MNRAEVAENLGLDGAASISLVGANLNMNIQQKHTSEEYDQIKTIISPGLF